MSELTPLQKKIKEIIVNTAQIEPYITNAAIRISLLMPSDLIGVSEVEFKSALKVERQRGYSNGYQAGKRAQS